MCFVCFMMLFMNVLFGCGGLGMSNQKFSDFALFYEFTAYNSLDRAKQTKLRHGHRHTRAGK